VTFRDDTRTPAVAYNAELVVLESEPRPLMLSRSYGQLLESAKSSEGEIKAIRLIRPA
jgi:hypothetical protein